MQPLQSEALHLAFRENKNSILCMTWWTGMNVQFKLNSKLTLDREGDN